MTYSDENRAVTTVGEGLHRRAEQILGKSNYTSNEYLGALERAEKEANAAEDVDDLAEQLLRARPALGGMDAARVLARVRLGVDSPPEDAVQREAERLAKSRGLSLDEITDYRMLAGLYAQAERNLQNKRTPSRRSTYGKQVSG